MFVCEKANVSDPSGDQRVTVFNEAAESMLGLSSAEVGRLFDYDKAAFAQLFEDVKFKTFLFKFRTKMEVYNVSLFYYLLLLHSLSLSMLAVTSIE